VLVDFVITISFYFVGWLGSAGLASAGFAWLAMSPNPHIADAAQELAHRALGHELLVIVARLGALAKSLGDPRAPVPRRQKLRRLMLVGLGNHGLDKDRTPPAFAENVMRNNNAKSPQKQTQILEHNLSVLR
jgi:hypothetical protein